VVEPVNELNALPVLLPPIRKSPISNCRHGRQNKHTLKRNMLH